MAVGLAPPGPVNDEAEQGDDASHGEEQAETEADTLLLAEGELKTLDGPGGDVELRVAVHGPVHGGEEEVEVADVDDAVVGDQVGRAKNGEAAAPHAEGQVVRGLEALGDDHDPELADQILAGGGRRRDVQAVAGFAPGGLAGDDELLDAESVVGGAPDVLADHAGRADEQGQVVVDEILGDLVRQIMFQDEVVGVGEIVAGEVVDDIVIDDDAPVEEQVLEAVRARRVNHEDEAAGAGLEVIAQQVLL